MRRFRGSIHEEEGTHAGRPFTDRSPTVRLSAQCITAITSSPSPPAPSASSPTQPPGASAPHGALIVREIWHHAYNERQCDLCLCPIPAAASLTRPFL